MSHLVKVFFTSLVLLIVGLLWYQWQPDTSLDLEHVSNAHPGSPSLIPEKEDAEPSTEQQVLVSQKIAPQQISSPDAQTLFTQAALVKGCQSTFQDEASLQHWLDKAYAEDENLGFINQKLAQFERCQGVNLKVDYISQLAEAALAGSAEALKLFWYTRDEEYFQIQGIAKSDREAVIQARQDLQLFRYQVAEQLAAKGNEYAMLLLMYGYKNHDEHPLGQDYVRSLALGLALLDMTENNDRYGEVEWFIERIKPNLQPEEIAQAHDLAQEIRLHNVASSATDKP